MLTVKKILFLNLKAFSKTGGIEKFNRAFLKGLMDLQSEKKLVAKGWSMHDEKVDEKYCNPKNYKGFNGKAFYFVVKSISAAATYDVIILGHINLAVIGVAIKKIFPRKQIILIAHGVEIWSKLTGVKKMLINNADKILAVSNFTKDTIATVHKIDPDKVTVFYNAIDPYFIYPKTFEKPLYLMDRYKLTQKSVVMLTLTRLSTTEKYKGYDTVIKLVPRLQKLFPSLRYLLAGKTDTEEARRIASIKEQNETGVDVTLTGFVQDNEVTDHYLLSDVFVLPSKKEGFGIVFIEAMACGLPVIAGNKDGSVDALQQGKLGCLVDPDDEEEIFRALEKILSRRDQNLSDTKKQMQEKVFRTFGYPTFKRNLEKVLVGL